MKRFNEHMLAKTAGGSVGGEALEGILQGIAGVIPYAVIAPMAAGSATGYIASKMSSPTDSDIEALQKRVLDTEVREKLALSKRRLESLRRRLQERSGIDNAAESRKRDMFV